MAQYDVADILARCKRWLNRPTSDNALADTDWYAFFAEGQAHWMREIATFAPEANITIEKLTTADGGLTYTLAYEPWGDLELRESRTGRLLIPGPEWDPETDFVPEGKTIRFPDNTSRTYSDGPYARYVREPATVDGSTAFIMKPESARVLIGYYACAQAAIRTKQDPAIWDNKQALEWFGDPLSGRIGIQAELKRRYAFAGATASPDGERRWWKPV